MNSVEIENIENELSKLEGLKLYESRENIHSKVIAYILKNNCEFLNKILEIAGIKIKDINSDNVFIAAETDNRKDIEIKGDNFVVVIENKYKDRNRRGQLEKYEKYICEQYDNFEKGFIYLRPFQHELSAKLKNWKSITYKDILDILYTLKADDEYLKRYKKIIEKIYEPQTICILALKEILGFSDNAIIVDNVRGDINGYAVEIHLGGKYGSFLEVAHSNTVEKKGEIEIYLTVKKENKTQSDNELFEILNNNQNKKENNENYEYITEKICSIKDYSPELIKEKFENSKIVKLLKQKNVFSASNDDMVV